MRRLLAFSFDLAVFSPFIFLLCFIAGVSTQYEIDYRVFYLIFFPLCISIFETYYSGKTPGKFIMRLRTVSIENSSLPLIIYFKRSAILTCFLPAISVFLIVIYEVFLKVPLYNATHYYSIGIFVVFLITPFLLTLGSQCGHDFLLKTSVISDSSDRIRALSNKYAYPLFIMIVIMVTGVSFFIHSNMDRVTAAVEERGYLEGISRAEMEMSGLTPDTSILERNVDDLFEYYDDLQGYLGLRELGELDKRIGIQTPPVFTFTINEPRYVPVFRVFVTAKGLINSRFKDAVTRNILEYSLSKTGSAICVVEFVHHDKYIGLFYLLVKQTQVGVHSGALEGSRYNSSMILTPEDSGYFSFSNTEIPPWVIE
ncbi:RDD family protein [Pseudomonadota bacterium]